MFNSFTRKHPPPTDTDNTLHVTDQPWLTVNDFCRLASISRATFYREVAAGRLRPIQVGGGRRKRITPQELRRYVAAQSAAG